MHIQAIETMFRGYKFRSRLEARWAVAFDNLGLNWQYEVEGFDLGKLGRYLPDFYLPDQKTFVEIKPENKTKRARKVYLAGKMGNGRDDWRNSLCWLGSTSLSLNEYKTREIDLTPMVNGHGFCGPFRVDELSGHGSGHLAMAGDSKAYWHGWPSGDYEHAQAIVFNTCKETIRYADTVFAWLDTTDCYGTVAELGYAHALGKEIWIGTSYERSQWNEMWFVLCMADRLASAKTPLDAFLEIDTPLQPHEQKCVALAGISSGVLLIEGSPDEKHQAYSVDYFVKEWNHTHQKIRAGNLALCGNRLEALHKGWVYPDTADKVSRALAKAKQARFEHGETP